MAVLVWQAGHLPTYLSIAGSEQQIRRGQSCAGGVVVLLMRVGFSCYACYTEGSKPYLGCISRLHFASLKGDGLWTTPTPIPQWRLRGKLRILAGRSSRRPPCQPHGAPHQPRHRGPRAHSCRVRGQLLCHPHRPSSCSPPPWLPCWWTRCRKLRRMGSRQGRRKGRWWLDAR